MDEYLVRGALLYCDCGSHKRRMNLPVSHGALVGEDQPMVHAGDSLAGDHISSFGVCSAECPPAGEDVYFQKEGTFDENGDRKTVGFGIVTGPACCPDINGEWMNAYKATLIADHQNPAGVPALTMQSFLVCNHGGIIRAEVSGQIRKLPQYNLEEAWDDFRLATTDVLSKVEALAEGTLHYHVKKAIEELANSPVARVVRGVAGWLR